MSLRFAGKPVLVFGKLALLVVISPMLLSVKVLPESRLPLQMAQAPRKIEADRLQKQGQEQFDTSQYEAAMRSWQKALKLYQEVKDLEGEGLTLVNLGMAFSVLGNYPKAIESYKQSLVIAREIKDQEWEGSTLVNLGVAYYSLSNYLKAIEYYEQGLAIAREVRNQLLQGRTLGNLGIAYRALGDYLKAIEYQEQSLAIAREVKNRLLEETSLNNLGIAYHVVGNYPKAIEYYEQSLTIAREIKNRLGEEQSLGNLGTSYSALGNYSRAIEYQEQSLAIAREIKDRLGEEKSLNNLGNAHRALGNYSKAIEYYEQSLTIAREIKDRLGEETSLNNLGIAYRALGNYSKAIEYYEQGLTIAREIKDRLGEGTSLNNLGNAYRDLGNYPKAEQVLIAAISIYESLRKNLKDTDKVSIADAHRNPYNNLQRVLIAQNKIETALETTERGRARAFAEILVQRTQGKDAPPIQPIQISAIKQAARQQQATLVEYANLDDDQLFIWVVKPTGDVAFRQVDLNPLKEQNTSLNNLIAAARCLGSVGCEEAVATRGNQEIAFDVAQGDRQFGKTPVITIKNEYLQRLHELLINPIADLLPTKPDERIIFIPQGRMFLLPFAALQDKQGKYLIEKHQIALSPSIQVLQLTHQQRQQRPVIAGNALLVGNPTMPLITYKPGDSPSTLIPLPGAEKEAKAISKLLKVPALIGKQATETRVRELMPTARIIHLATHGLLDDIGGQGLPGAIALTSDNKNDGLLTANELLNMKLQAELVVLSACDTGRGKITGDGVIGLSRSLMTAGVPSVVVSLWKVPDAATADLMTHFYRHLSQGKDKSAALRQAMLDTRKEFPDPVNWAAFILMGEAK